MYFKVSAHTNQQIFIHVHISVRFTQASTMLPSENWKIDENQLKSITRSFFVKKALEVKFVTTNFYPERSQILSIKFFLLLSVSSLIDLRQSYTQNKFHPWKDARTFWTEVPYGS